MKFFAVFSAVLALSLASPAEWSVHDLSVAIQSPSTDANLVPLLQAALSDLLDQTTAGSPVTTTTVSSPVQDFSVWTLNELSEAIQNPATDPALLPYLEHGLNNLMSNVFAGQQQQYVIIGTPVGLLPIEAAAPIVPIVAPTPVATPIVSEASASPLVQIIINIKDQQTAAPVDIVHEPIIIDDQVPVVPSPVVIPAPVVLPSPPSPVVIPAPVVLPAPVAPEVIEPNPIDIIAVNPEAVVNPIDIIAISAPEITPVGVVGAVDVGPMM